MSRPARCGRPLARRASRPPVADARVAGRAAVDARAYIVIVKHAGTHRDLRLPVPELNKAPGRQWPVRRAGRIDGCAGVHASVSLASDVLRFFQCHLVLAE